MQSNNILGLVPAKMLQPEVLAAAKDLDPDAILALKPGAKVSLDIQIGGEEQMKAESAIRASLEQIGMEVVPDSPLRIRHNLWLGNSETKEYGSGFFNRENREQVTTTDQRSKWSSRSTANRRGRRRRRCTAGQPAGGLAQGGRSAQQAVDRQNAARTAGFSFSASIPRYVVHPKYAEPMGTSKIFGRR